MTNSTRRAAVLALGLCAVVLASIGDKRSEPSAGRPPLVPVLPAGAPKGRVQRPMASVPSAPELPTAAPPAPPDCPIEMQRIGRFCVDRWEAHLIERSPSGSETVHPHFARPAAGVRYQARSAAGVFPQGYVSRSESAAACEAAGKRLCSYREWRRACQGKHGQRYPYGEREKLNACNSKKHHLLAELFGIDARRWEYDKHFNSPALLQQADYLAKTGAYPQCKSGDGVFDLVGNLHEWVSGTVTRKFVTQLYREKVPRKEQKHWRHGNGIFTGGFFSTGHQLGPGCYYTTIAHEASYHDYSTGFRCCQDAPPGPRLPPGRVKIKK